MRMLLLIVALTAGAYLVGRQAFDRSEIRARAIAPIQMASVPIAHRPSISIANATPARTPRVPRRHVALEPPTTTEHGDLGPVDDDILLEMMTNHGEAMEMLREDIYFTAVERFGSCPELIQRRTVCWLNYYVEIEGQFMRTRLITVNCGADEALAACLRQRLAAPVEPLGIPQGAADELGAYAGPVQVPLTWYPKEPPVHVGIPDRR